MIIEKTMGDYFCQMHLILRSILGQKKEMLNLAEIKHIFAMRYK